MATVYGHFGKLSDSVFAYFTIDPRPLPIAEVYDLRDGNFLVLSAGVAGGYSRKIYKTSTGAIKAAKRDALRLARMSFSEVDYKFGE